MAHTLRKVMAAHIRSSMVKAIPGLALLVGLVAGDVSGAAFRLSFLEQEPVLTDTCQLMMQTGFSDDSVATFRKLVEHHNKKGNRVDKTKFPAPVRGYYEFRDLADFTSRLRTVLHWTPTDHSPDQDTFTCFDAACLLLYGAGCETPGFEKDLYSKGVFLPSSGPQGFRSYYRRGLFPENRDQQLTGKARSEAETQLIFSIRATRVLAPEATNELAWRAAVTSYFRSLQAGGFVIPKGFQLGLGFYAMAKLGRLQSDHAFLCIPQQGRLVCIEKNGGPGPYVRAEFESEQDLACYMSWSMLEDARKNKNLEYVLVSLNDRLIGAYRREAEQ